MILTCSTLKTNQYFKTLKNIVRQFFQLFFDKKQQKATKEGITYTAVYPR